MRVMALFSTSFFVTCLHVGEDGPGRGHLCHTDTFLVYYMKNKMLNNILPSFLNVYFPLNTPFIEKKQKAYVY